MFEESCRQASRMKKNKRNSSISETSAPALERTVADISERLTHIDHQFDYKIKKQRDQTLLVNADLIGLRNFYGKRLDTLEQTSETQKHELKLCNENFRESQAQTDASFHKDKISLANMESALREQKDSIDNLSKLLPDADRRLENQEKFTKSLSGLFPDVENKLNEQKKIFNRLASKMESALKERATTTDVNRLMSNYNEEQRNIRDLTEDLEMLSDRVDSDDLLRLHTKNELQTHQKQIANLEQKISGIQYDATEEFSEIIKKQNYPRIDVDRIEKMENSIEELKKKSQDSSPAKTCESWKKKKCLKSLCENVC